MSETKKPTYGELRRAYCDKAASLRLMIEKWGLDTPTGDNVVSLAAYRHTRRSRA